MKPEVLQHSRHVGFAQSRSLLDANGVAIDISAWTGEFEARYIQQLHGRADEAFSVATDTTGNTSSVSIPALTIAATAANAALILWTHIIYPPAGDGVMLGWGLMELSP